jgi:formyl-CoA transferase
MGEPTWTAESRFQTMAGRKKHEGDMDRLLEEWTSGLTAQEVMVRLQEQGVSAGVVQNTRDLIENDAGYRDRHIRLLDHPEAGTMTTHGETIAISGLEPRVQRSPLLGEHTEYVLKDLLGMDERQIDQLYVDGVLR